MTSKEKLWVALAILIISNLSIVLTLYVSGFFDSNEPPPPTEEELAQMAAAAAVADKYKFKPDEDGDFAAKPNVQAVRTLSEAFYICSDKVEASVSRPKSYNYNHKASYFDDAEGVFKIFIDLETASTASGESKDSEVTCEVSAESGGIVNYKDMEK